MAENSKIEWTRHTFNFWRGCEHATLPNGSQHPGCANCYAEAMSRRNPAVLGRWGDENQGSRVMAAASYLLSPLKWDRAAKSAGERHRVFCLSLGDVFEDWQGPILDAHGRELWLTERTIHAATAATPCDPELSRRLTMDDLRRELFAIIDATPNLDWLLLTKRPENVRRMWPTTQRNVFHGNAPPAMSLEREHRRLNNVWLLTSVSDQATADAMVPPLLECRDLVPVLGLSCEPLLSAVDLGLDEMFVDLDNGTQSPGIDWVIVGGESGHGARPCDAVWIDSLVRQCRAVQVPCFVKQLGAKPFDSREAGRDSDEPHSDGAAADPDCRLHLIDRKGGDIEEWPEELCVREFPEVPTHA